MCCSSCIEHDQHADNADESADNVVAVGLKIVYFPGPKEGQDNEDAAIGGIDAAEAGRLIGGDDPVPCQKDGASDAVPDGVVFFEPKPDKITAADFTETGQNK